ncbi:MAG: radical SAM protein [Flavobacterium sp.]|nr:MAG: radical SAM protein [Flavobacterium sp.]
MVIQPTSLCNLNCTYCYLPNRNKNLFMPLSTAKKIADELVLLDLKNTVNIIWHSGEPLTCGVKKFAELLEIFEPLRKEKLVRHSIQTNGSLITKEWCELFLNYNIAVGVSIDGPRSFTAERVDWAGNENYDKIINGIELLKKFNVSFGVICVVTQKSIVHAKTLYNFFCALGCEAAGFSIVEEEGVNKNLLLNQDADSGQFWKDLLNAWFENPIIGIREFRRAIVWLESEAYDKQSASIVKDILPSISYNGDVVLLSPEFMDIKPHSNYKTFIVGNILNSSLSESINNGLESHYIRDYIEGMNSCKDNCQYFGFCRGGDASNKFFEAGSLNITETNHCKNTKMELVEAVLQKI